ncbi:hypothetical protein PQY68_05495 [Planktomarina temperata]|nr:hypothetical protein [Planktomarina temperata]MDC6454682.1 hypothetical protein [Planktomarina temperata]
MDVVFLIAELLIGSFIWFGFFHLIFRHKDREDREEHPFFNGVVWFSPAIVYGVLAFMSYDSISLLDLITFPIQVFFASYVVPVNIGNYILGTVGLHEIYPSNFIDIGIWKHFELIN